MVTVTDVRKVLGVYKIKNTATGQEYVGQSSRMLGRWKDHLRMLSSGIHTNQKMQSSWNKYGEAFFEFELLEECDEKSLTIVEQKYLDLVPANKRFNITAVADCPGRGRIHSEQEKSRRSASLRGRRHKGRPICAERGDEKHYFDRIYDARSIGIPSSCANQVLRGVCYSYKGWKIRYTDGKPHPSGGRKDEFTWRKKSVSVLWPDGDFQVFESFREAADWFGLHGANIHRSVRRGKNGGNPFLGRLLFKYHYEEDQREDPYVREMLDRQMGRDN